MATYQYLKRLYPGIADQIEEAASKGKTPDEIQAQVYKKVNEAIQGGYDAKDVPDLLGLTPPQPSLAREFVKGAGAAVSGLFGGAPKTPFLRLPEFTGARRAVMEGPAESPTPPMEVGFGQYLPTPSGAAYTLGEQLAGLGLFSGAFKGAQSVLGALPSATGKVTRPLVEGLKTYGAGVGSSAALAAPSGMEAVKETLMDPYVQLGSLGGGALGGAGVRPVAPKPQPVDLMTTAFRKALERTAASKAEQVDLTPPTPTQQEVVKSSPQVRPEQKMSDSTLLRNYAQNPADPTLSAEVQSRATSSKAFSQLASDAVLQSAEARKTVTGTGTVGKKAADEIVRGVEYEGLPNFKFDRLTDQELQSGAQDIANRYDFANNLMETPALKSRKKMYQEIQNKITAELERRGAEKVTPDREAPAQISQTGALTADDVQVSDFVHYLGSEETGGQVSHRLGLYSQYPGNQFLKLGETTLPDAQFKAMNLTGRMGREAPSNVIAQPPKTEPVKFDTLIGKAERIFGKEDMITTARIQRALNVSYNTADRLAKTLREERYSEKTGMPVREVPPVPESAGAAAYEGEPTRPAAVNSAITRFQELSDKLKAANKSPGLVKTYEQAITDLQTQGTLSPATRRALGFGGKETVERPVAERPAPEVPEPPERVDQPPEKAPTPPPEITPRLVSETDKPITAGAESAPEAPRIGTHQVLLFEGDKVVGQITNLDLDAANTIAEAGNALYQQEFPNRGRRAVIQELPSPAPETREGTSRLGPSMGLGKSRRFREIPVGQDIESGIQRLEAETVRLGRPPGEPPAQVYSLSGIRSLAETKGVQLHVTDKGQIQMFDPNGVTWTARGAHPLKEATEHLLNMPEAASRTSVNKAIEGKELTKQDRTEIEKFSQENFRLEPSDSDPPPIDRPAKTQGPDETPPMPPPIAGGAGWDVNDQLRVLAATKYTDAGDQVNFISNMNKLFREFPDIVPFWQAEMSAPKAAFSAGHAIDYWGMPQFSSNPIISTVSLDSVMRHSIPKYNEWGHWNDYHNLWWGKLTPEQDRNIFRAMEKKIPLSNLDPAARQGYDAAIKFKADMSQRLGKKDWDKFLGQVIDKQKSYEDWRQILLRERFFENQPTSIQNSFGGSEAKYEMVRRAFEKNDQVTGLPKDVRRIWDKELVTWYSEADYDQVPGYLKAMVPKEMWASYNLAGGHPVIESWRTTFRKILPVMMNELYTREFFDKWQPLIDSLPGNAYQGLTTKAYLSKWSMLAQNKNDIGAVSRAFDEQVKRVENAWGKSIADPDFLGRLAGRVGVNVYRGTLGLALDTATANMFGMLNTWAETGRVSRAIAHKLFNSDINKLANEVIASNKNVGILKEMSYHLLEGGSPDRGVNVNKLLADKLKISEAALDKLDDGLTKIAMAPMHVTENILRGVAFRAALDEAVAQGLDHTTALRLGMGRQSQVVPNLRLTEAHLEALAKTAKTQYAYEKEFQSPYTQGSLFKLSTLFWSYPTKQMQFLQMGMGNALHDWWHEPDWDSRTRMVRYTALLGLTAGGAWLGSKVGLNLESVFGSGLLPRTFGMVYVPLLNSYQAVLGREPLTDKKWEETTRTLTYMMGIPGRRYVGKAYDAIQSTQRGYEADRYGRKLYDTTGYGEFARLFGIEYGQTYASRLAARAEFEKGAQIDEARKNAMNDAVNNNDTSSIEKFNEKYGTEYGPSVTITAEDVNRWARNAQKPLAERASRYKGVRQVEQERYGYQP